MYILIAADSFKESLSAKDVCQSIAMGVRLANNSHTVHLFPMADGGEGTASVLSQNTSGTWITTTVHDPLFREVSAGYGLSPDGQTAFIDMAQASGLDLLTDEEKNPLQTTTLGTGELLLHAIEQGAKRVVLGIGGSATNDAGIGMAHALGYRFYDAAGKALSPIGESLNKIDKIDNSQRRLKPHQIQVDVLCDVDNPLYGPEGAAHVYAAQKGANGATITVLDEGLKQFATFFPDHHFSKLPGAGASGGLGAGAIAFLGATLKPGVETIMQLTGFESHLQKSTLVLTGEGKLDEQSLRGKLIGGICQKAQQYGIPVIALCGQLTAPPEAIKQMGLQAAFSIAQGPQSLAEAMAQTSNNLKTTAFHILRTFHREA